MGRHVQKMNQVGLLGLLIGLMVKSCFGRDILQLNDNRDLEDSIFQPEYDNALFDTLKENEVMKLETDLHIRNDPEYNSACKDKLPAKKCEKFKKDGKCSEANGKKKCKKTCGYCDDITTTPPTTTCEDKIVTKKCKKYKKQNKCEKFKEKCQK